MKRLVVLVVLVQTLGVLLAVPHLALAGPLDRVTGKITFGSPILMDYDSDGIEEQCQPWFQFSAFDGGATRRADTGTFVQGYRDVASGEWVKGDTYQVLPVSSIRMSAASSQDRVFSFDVTHPDGSISHYAGSDSGKGYEHDTFLQLNILQGSPPSVAVDFPLSGGDIKLY